MAGLNETKQRFLRLGVGEISLVDTPANEEEWLQVLKRLGGETMTVPNAAPNAEAAAPPAEDAAPTEDKTVEKVADAAPAEDAAPPELDDDVQKSLEVVMKGMNPGAAMSFMSKLYKQLHPHFGGVKKADEDAKPAAEPDKPVVKQLLTLGEDGTVTIDPAMVDIAKAKQFTGARVEQLEATAKTVLDLLAEVSPESVEKLTGAKPEATEVATQKSLDDSALKDLITEAVTTANADVTKRLDAIEGARGVPKSDGGADDVADVADVEKNDDKSVFAGVL